MSSDSERCYISFPTSLVKAPGLLLKDKKDPSEVRTHYKDIQSLLGTFKSKIESPFISLTHLTTTTETRMSNFETGTNRLFESLLSPNVSLSLKNDIKSPGKLKSKSDKMSTLFQQAKDILSIYNIELVLENSKISRPIYNLLKVFIPEICFFPSDFFKKLQINKLVFSENTHEQAFSHGSAFISIHTVDSEEKVRQRLYKIIFDHLLVTSPHIFRQWKEIVLSEHKDLEMNLLQQFEEDFMALMNNKNHALLRFRIKKLRELLAKSYPEAMSEEKFKQRNREKRKMFSVRFETEPF